MRFKRLFAQVIAITAMTIMPPANVMIAVQTKPPTPSSPAIEDAAKHEARVFKGYVVFLVAVGIATAGWTVALWIANNKYLDAVKADADARILTVQSDAKTDSSRIEQQGKKDVAKVEADARERIARVEFEASLKIADANHRTAQLAKDAEELKSQNLTTEANLEAERRTRLELEVSLAPRIAHWGASIPKWRPLKEYSGMQVKLRVASDAEAQSAARELIRALEAAEFVFVDKSIDDHLTEHAFEGVTIHPCGPEMPPPPLPPSAAKPVPLRSQEEQKEMLEWMAKEKEVMAEMQRCRAAANAIAEWLAWNGWLKVTASAAESIPANTIAIEIGTKPNPYFELE